MGDIVNFVVDWSVVGLMIAVGLFILFAIVHDFIKGVQGGRSHNDGPGSADIGGM